MRARYYNPDTGRFISEDTHWNPSNMIYGDKTFDEGEIKYPDVTASLQAGNLYAYCMGNPVKYKDIMGFAVYGRGASGAIGLGAVISGQVFYVWDDHGNEGIMLSGGIGGGLALSAKDIGLKDSFADVLASDAIIDELMFEDMDNINELKGGGTEIVTIFYSYQNSGGKYESSGFTVPSLEARVTFTGTMVFTFDEIKESFSAVKNKIVNFAGNAKDKAISIIKDLF